MDLVQHFWDWLDQIGDYVGVSLLVDVIHLLVCCCQTQENDQVFEGGCVVAQFRTQEVVVGLRVLIQQVEQLVNLRHVSRLISLILSKQLIKLLLQIRLILLHTFRCVLINNDCSIELPLVTDVILGAVIFLILLAEDYLLDEGKGGVVGLVL